MRKIYYSETGGMGVDGVWWTSFKLFDFEEGEKEGKGFQYSRSGERYGHWWCHTSPDREVTDILTKEQLYSFYHGSCEFSVPKHLVSDNFSELIKNADFRIVDPEDVAIAEKVDSIKTISDIVDNWDYLSDNYFNYAQITACFKDLNYSIGPAKNGEIGIQAMGVIETFRVNVDLIKDMLFEKHKSEIEV